MPANVLLLAIWTSVLFPLKFSAYIFVALVVKYFYINNYEGSVHCNWLGCSGVPA